MPGQTAVANPDHYLVSANGLLGQPPQSPIGAVEIILSKAVAAKPENGLVIHFHGGLNARQYALDNIVVSLTPTYAEAGGYPLFFVWESGFAETILNNKAQLLRDPAFRELVKKVSEWVLGKTAIGGVFGFRGADGVPIEDTDQFRKEYDKWFAGDEEQTRPPGEHSSDLIAQGVKTRAGRLDEDQLAQEIEQSLDGDPAFKRALNEAYNASVPPADIVTKGVGSRKPAEVMLLSESALNEMFPAENDATTRGVFTWLGVAKFVAKLVIAVAGRYKDNTDHGLHCTVVEEVLRSAYGDLIGSAIWNQMKEDTLDSFADVSASCGLAVVKQLKALEVAGTRFRKLTLVGHSTGAIYICNFLDAAEKLGLETPIQVVFLAPAVTCARFAEAIDAHQASRLKDFRMFAMRDALESQDQMLAPLYTRSLLYLVSGLLEGQVDKDNQWAAVTGMPLVGMERFYNNSTYAQAPAVVTVKSFLEAVPGRTVWSSVSGAGDGYNSSAAKHGDFDNDRSTLDSVQFFIRQ
jgi:hypothetical protein